MQKQLYGQNILRPVAHLPLYPSPMFPSSLFPKLRWVRLLRSFAVGLLLGHQGCVLNTFLPPCNLPLAGETEPCSPSLAL